MPHLRFLALAGSLLAGSALHAQQDSLASLQPVGVRVDSIVPGTADRAATSTLGELLKGRAAGLNVAESSGSLGAAPRMWVRGVSSLVLATRPLVVVDGVPAVAWADTVLGALTPSVSAVEMLHASDVSSVHVLRGPAATAHYGPEGAAGVLEIRTRAGEAVTGGGLRTEAWSALSARSDAGRYPLRYRRPGLSSGGAGGTCTTEVELLGGCTPVQSTPDATDPMAEADPFRTGTGFAAGARVAGGALGGRVGFGLQVSSEDADGAHRQDARRQRAVAGSARATLPGGPVLDFRGALARRELTLPMEGNSVLATSARVLLYDDVFPPTFGYRNEADTDWTRVGLAFDWPLVPWLSMGGRWGRDRAESDGRQQYRGPGGNFSTEGHARRKREEWQALASARGAMAGAHGALSAGVGRVAEASAREIESRHQESGSGTSHRLRETIDTEHGFVRAGVGYGGLAVAATARRDRFQSGAPLGDRDSYSVGAEWGLGSTLRPGWLDGLRLRAAHGSTMRGLERAEDPRVIVCPGGCTAPDPERLTEAEAGVDLSAFGFLDLGASVYRRRTDDLLAVGAITGPPGFSTLANVGSMRNRGVEASAAASGVAGRAEWRLEARQSWNRNRLDLSGREFAGGVSFLAHRNGYPAGSLFGYRLTWQDLDGNGVLRGACAAPQVCEVQRSAEVDFLGTSVPDRVGSALASVRFGTLRAHALADWQGGVHRYDTPSSLFCSARNCEESYVRGRRMAEQARLVGPLQNEGWVHDAGFVRLREVSLTLAAPARLLRGLSRGVDVTLAGRNLAVWTSYPGFDPETAGTGASPFAWRGLFEQPPLRTVTTRIDVRF